MGYSRAEKAESRERILNAAARQIRLGGLDSVRISDLMRDANLTHGGFYGHFSSRAALIAAALDRALENGAEAFTATEHVTVKTVVNNYLNVGHRDNASDGCPIGALAGEVGRSGDIEVRDSMVRGIEQSFLSMANSMGGGTEAEEAAVKIWCAMVGAISLSRVLRGTDRSEQVLRLARRLVMDLNSQVQDADASTLPYK